MNTIETIKFRFEHGKLTQQDIVNLFHEIDQLQSELQIVNTRYERLKTAVNQSCMVAGESNTRLHKVMGETE